MTNLTIPFVVAALLLSLPANSATSRKLRGADLTVSISAAKIPSGFDPSDVVTIVSGYYPNSCYSWARAEVEHKTAYIHEIKAIAHVNLGACLTVMIPFSEEVHLGTFARGNHVLRYLSGDSTYFEAPLNIE